MKMSAKVEEHMLAPCGVMCLACSAHLSGKNACPGCRTPPEQITRKSCRNCAKKTCAFDQGLKWCFECGRFPCAKIKSLNKTYLQNYNVDLIQNGLEAKRDMVAFLREQRRRFTCKSCGGVVNQHNKQCSECAE